MKTNRNHHLEFRRDRGVWRMKVTIFIGDKLVGRRVVVPLNCRDVETARMLRDSILHSLSRRGLLARPHREENSLGDECSTFEVAPNR